MLKYFVCILAILFLFMTIQSDITSDNYIYNEDEQKEHNIGIIMELGR